MRDQDPPFQTLWYIVHNLLTRSESELRCVISGRIVISCGDIGLTNFGQADATPLNIVELGNFNGIRSKRPRRNVP